MEVLSNGRPTGPSRRKSSNLLSSALNRSNTMPSDRAALSISTDLDMNSHDGLGTPILESGASTPALASASLPNVPSQSLQVAHEAQRNAVTRRLQSWSYLKSVHQGDQVHWFNTIRLSKAELEAYYHSASNMPAMQSNMNGQNAKSFTPISVQKRATRFVVLGLSLGPLLDIANPQDFLKALLATSQEYDQLSDDNLLRPKVVRLFLLGLVEPTLTSLVISEILPSSHN